MVKQQRWVQACCDMKLTVTLYMRSIFRSAMVAFSSALFL